VCCLLAAGLALAFSRPAAADMAAVIQAANRGDYEGAYRLVLPLAEAGDADAQAHLCSLMRDHLVEHGTMRDAFAWCQKAADAGNAGGMNILGGMYYKGQGTPKDLRKFIYWKEKSAALGNRGAAGDLATAYATGLGVARDPQQASRYRHMAERGGHELPHGAAGDPGIVAKILHDQHQCDGAIAQGLKAAEAGDGEAAAWVGQCLVERRAANEQQRGVALLRQASAAGNGNASYFLGLAYRKGAGVPADLARALDAFEKSQAQGTGLAAQQVYEVRQLLAGIERQQACRSHPEACPASPTAPAGAGSAASDCEQHQGTMRNGICVRYTGQVIDQHTGTVK